MVEPSPSAARFAARARVVLFNVLAVTTIVHAALLVPLRANFTPIRLDAMDISSDETARFRPNLRDEVYTHARAPGSARGYLPIRVSTNAEGFRDIDHRVANDAAAFRVAFFGDSFMFGLGLEQSETLPSVMGRELGAGSETFNFGVPGMNLEGMGRMTQSFGLKYRPDVAVYSFICDDVSTTDSLSVSRWRLGLRGVTSRLPRHLDQHVESLLVTWKMARYTSDYRAISLTPWLFRRRVGVVLDYLYALADRGGHEVVLIDYCRVGFVDAVRRYDAARGRRTAVIDDFALELNRNDQHPTAACIRGVAARLRPLLEAVRARRAAASARPAPRP